MGMDIHAFLEYDDTDKKPFTWIVSCFAEVYLERNYDLFGALGLIGVSGSPVTGSLGTYNEIVKRENPRRPLFPSRGIPHPMSGMARGSIEMRVVDEDDDEEEEIINSKSFFVTDQRDGTSIRRKDAERLIESGKSKYLLDDEGNESNSFITNPDYKFPSWLLLSELKKAVSDAGFSKQIADTVPDQKDEVIHALPSFRFLRRLRRPQRRPQEIDDLPLDYELLILTMELIEKKIGNGRTRLVYWFE
jgi:hypothetical protein